MKGPLPADALAPPAVEAIPWFAWVAALAATSTVVGVQWDIAWHQSIGRDSFWVPPHLAIQFGGMLAGLAFGYLILHSTLSRTPSSHDAAVRVWGLHGPLGAFVAAWGGIAMIASAPFDDWWHNTYGLDVKILSPPHTVLALGLFGILFGALILCAGLMNRCSARVRPAATALFLYLGGILLLAVMTFVLEYSGRWVQHSGIFYRVMASTAPVVLVAVGRASGHRFGATATAAIYSAILLLLLWGFPLVPAAPKLGPVYHPVTHLIPTGFPILLLFPALAMDLAGPPLAGRGAWFQALVLGALFVAVLLAVQWPFASFLMTAHARNWVFGAHYLGYYWRVDWSAGFRHLDGSRAHFWAQMALALGTATITSRCGLAFGDWLHRVKR